MTTEPPTPPLPLSPPPTPTSMSSTGSSWLEDEWSGDWWVPSDGRLVTRRDARALVLNRSVLHLGDSTSRRLTATMAMQLLGDRPRGLAENLDMLNKGAHLGYEWALRLSKVGVSTMSFYWQYIEKAHHLYHRSCVARVEKGPTPDSRRDVLVVAAGMHDLGPHNGGNESVFRASLEHLARVHVAALACWCEALPPSSILIWRTVPAIGQSVDRERSAADERAANHSSLLSVPLFNQQMLLFNRMVLDLAFCPNASSSAGALTEADLKAQACLARRLRIADFSRAMLRHDADNPNDKLHAPPGAAQLPHYNNLARSIEGQLVYRAWMDRSAAGPAGTVPCAPWPGWTPRWATRPTSHG